MGGCELGILSEDMQFIARQWPHVRGVPRLCWQRARADRAFEVLKTELGLDPDWDGGDLLEFFAVLLGRDDPKRVNIAALSRKAGVSDGFLYRLRRGKQQGHPEFGKLLCVLAALEHPLPFRCFVGSKKKNGPSNAEQRQFGQNQKVAEASKRPDSASGRVSAGPTDTPPEGAIRVEEGGIRGPAKGGIRVNEGGIRGSSQGGIRIETGEITDPWLGASAANDGADVDDDSDPRAAEWRQTRERARTILAPFIQAELDRRYPLGQEVETAREGEKRPEKSSCNGSGGRYGEPATLDDASVEVDRGDGGDAVSDEQEWTPRHPLPVKINGRRGFFFTAIDPSEVEVYSDRGIRTGSGDVAQVIREHASMTLQFQAELEQRRLLLEEKRIDLEDKRERERQAWEQQREQRRLEHDQATFQLFTTVLGTMAENSKDVTAILKEMREDQKNNKPGLDLTRIVSGLVEHIRDEFMPEKKEKSNG